MGAHRTVAFHFGAPIHFDANVVAKHWPLLKKAHQQCSGLLLLTGNLLLRALKDFGEGSALFIANTTCILNDYF